MNNPDKRIPEDIAPEVLELASRNYANHTQSYSASELVAAGEEVDIPAEFIQQAILDVQARHKQQQQQQQYLAHLRQKLFIAAAGMVATLSVWSIWTYNSISSSHSRVEAAWAQVENQLQRRADLIPNLVNVTQAYAKQEQELVSLLVRSRQTYLQATTPEEKVAATVQVNQAIDRFRDYATVNPQLQSSQLFTNLQYELTGTENRLAVERMRYNQAVQAYNQKIQSFPNVLVANTLGFEKKDFFQATNTNVPIVP
ncbi:LemA family protein [Gloeocapsopsis crepidinum LEGE 06123]|uniref:LemA family protein n=1 Tax=Gloeocapsopsis crepidinum LEGE 06123 TaxID=588587 RepID=A0ABR9UPQ4_9CHRO|nr:LemA family protein [Gloeocapsopsis crepidinum]MBE9190262.1 LemA family protein [Gloeocapsopsis crepidinum LEGE 06123]